MSARERRVALLRLLANLLLPRSDREFIVGDILERHLRGEAERASAWRWLPDLLRSAVVLRVERVRSLRWDSGVIRPGGPLGRRISRGSWTTALSADFVTVARGIRRESGFTAVCVAILALGVGSTAAVFGIIDQLILTPIPGVQDASRLSYVQFADEDGQSGAGGGGISTSVLMQLSRHVPLLDGVVSYGRVEVTAAVGGGRPIRLAGNTVYGPLFQVLGIHAAAGHLFDPGYSHADADLAEIVISERIGQTLFGSAANALGQPIRLNEERFRVVGVTGRGFAGPDRGVTSDFWLPMSAQHRLLGDPTGAAPTLDGVIHTDLIVRLSRGARAESAREQIRGVLASERVGGSGPGVSPLIFPGLTAPPSLRPAIYRMLRILSLVGALVLLVACANVANLLLVRNVRAQGAVATRRALGASRGRIAREHLGRSLALSLLATVAGVGVASAIILVVGGSGLAQLPELKGLAIDSRVLLFGAAISVGTTVLFGMWPAFAASRFDVSSVLRRGAGSNSGRHGRARDLLTAVQLGMSLSLVVCGLLLLRTTRNLQMVDTGVDVSGVFSLPVSYSHSLSVDEADNFYRDLLAAVSAFPEVEGAGISPYGMPGSTILGRIALPESPSPEVLRAGLVPITPGLLPLLGVETVHGRVLARDDWAPGAAPRVVLTRSLALKLFGETNISGRTVLAGFTAPAPMTVVGVVGDIRSVFSLDQPEDLFFITYTHAAGLPFDWLTLLFRTPVGTPLLLTQIREAVETVVPGEAIPEPQPVSNSVLGLYREARTFSHLLTLLALLAVVLSAAGLYSTTSFIESTGRREFGLRLALGARALDIGRLVAGRTGWAIMLGTVGGLAGAYVLGRVLRSRLFGVGTLDPGSYLIAVGILAALVVISTMGPIWRATRADPVEAMRQP